MARQYFHPFINTVMLALPYTYRHVPAAGGVLVKVTIPGENGGSWSIKKTTNGWVMDASPEGHPAGELILDANIAWKLFTKSIRPAAVEGQVQLRGDIALVEPALSMVSVMA